MSYVRDAADGCVLSVRVHPGARRNAVTGVHAEALKIALTTPPVDGRANEALIAFLAERLQVPKRRIYLMSGATSRTKIMRVEGMSAELVKSALDPVEAC